MSVLRLFRGKRRRRRGRLRRGFLRLDLLGSFLGALGGRGLDFDRLVF